jgi:ectoine hydroxylase
MQITSEQLETYQQDGYLFLPEYFTAGEVDMLVSELPSVFAEDSPRRVMEKDGYGVRSVYGSHMTSPVFQVLARHPKLVMPVKQILGSEVYVYQFKINAKLALVGDVWEWHQDYVFWLKEDGMLSPRVINAVIFLHEVNEFNGPMFLIPGSHREGVVDVPARNDKQAAYSDSPAWISNLTANLKYSINKDTLTELVKKYGIVAPKGQRGSVLFFHPNMVHASSPNMSPYDRPLAIVSYNSVENVPQSATKTQRPEFLVSRDCSPVEPISPDALLSSSVRH